MHHSYIAILVYAIPKDAFPYSELLPGHKCQAYQTYYLDKNTRFNKVIAWSKMPEAITWTKRQAITWTKHQDIMA